MGEVNLAITSDSVNHLLTLSRNIDLRQIWFTSMQFKSAEGSNPTLFAKRFLLCLFGVWM